MERDNSRTEEYFKIALFSMEIGIDHKMPTYSGGLGVLADDILRSCADLSVPRNTLSDILMGELPG